MCYFTLCFHRLSRSKVNEMFAQTALIDKSYRKYFKTLFLSSPCAMSVGVYAWIGINFVLGRFEHIEDGKYHVSN